MIEVEICLNTDNSSLLAANAMAASKAGAARVELCSAMHLQGLTPDEISISTVRNSWGSRSGVMAMIRPRAGDFIYNNAEITSMERQIYKAACAGADGVVFGVLQKDGTVNVPVMEELIALCGEMQLTMTFHRAIDACVNPVDAWQDLQRLGVTRVLTSGTPWLSEQSALNGLGYFEKYLALNRDSNMFSPELIIGGGVNAEVMKTLLSQLDDIDVSLSFHCYSAVLTNDCVDYEKVSQLVKIARYRSH